MMRGESVSSQRKIKTPKEAFWKCPACRNERLLVLESDVFCTHCGWDSLEAVVAAGGFEWCF